MYEIEGKDLEDELEKIFHGVIEHFGKRGELLRVGISQVIHNQKIGEVFRSKLKEERIPSRVAKTEEYKAKNWIRKDLDSWAVTYGLMLMSFGLGFIGLHLHHIDSKKLKQVGSVMAKVLAKGLK